jgi:hypothetical protein
MKNISFVGETAERTNWLSAALMDMAGNPYGTYRLEKPCIHCGMMLEKPPPRNVVRKILTKAAFWTRQIQKPFLQLQPNWMHVLLERPPRIV